MDGVGILLLNMRSHYLARASSQRVLPLEMRVKMAVHGDAHLTRHAYNNCPCWDERD